MVQAIDRLRLIHSEREKTVVILCNIPLDLPVDELVTWRELVGDGRLVKTLEICEQNGWGALPLAPAELAGPLNWLTIPGYSTSHALPQAAIESPRPEAPRAAMPILGFFFCRHLVRAGAMAAHLPGLLQTTGASATLAIGAAALVGPTQVAARIVEFGLLRSFHPLYSARIASMLHPIGAAILILFGAPGIVAFALLHGAGNGMITIAKGNLPLALFGPREYGLRSGTLSVAARILQSAAPFLFGLLLDRVGIAVIGLSAGLCLSAFGSLLMLRASSARADPSLVRGSARRVDHAGTVNQAPTRPLAGSVGPDHPQPGHRRLEAADISRVAITLPVVSRRGGMHVIAVIGQRIA